MDIWDIFVARLQVRAHIVCLQICRAMLLAALASNNVTLWLAEAYLPGARPRVRPPRALLRAARAFSRGMFRWSDRVARWAGMPR